MDDGNASVIGGDVLVVVAGGVDIQVGGGGGSIGIGSEDEDLVFEIGDEGSALGDGSDEQRRFADGDGLAAGFGVVGGILHGGLNEHACCLLSEGASGEVGGQFEVEVICAVGVGLALLGGGFEGGDIHGMRLSRRSRRGRRACRRSSWRGRFQ